MFVASRFAPRCSKCPRGVAAVEVAVTLSTTLLVLAGLLDLGLAAMRKNALGHASRSLARILTLRGSDAPDGASAIGPGTLTGHAGDSSLAAAYLSQCLPTMSPAAVEYTIDWLDDDNGPGDPVRVELQFTHVPLLLGLSPWGAMQIKAVSTMRVVN